MLLHLLSFSATPLPEAFCNSPRRAILAMPSPQQIERIAKSVHRGSPEFRSSVFLSEADAEFKLAQHICAHSNSGGGAIDVWGVGSRPEQDIRLLVANAVRTIIGEPKLYISTYIKAGMARGIIIVSAPQTLLAMSKGFFKFSSGKMLQMDEQEVAREMMNAPNMLAALMQHNTLHGRALQKLSLDADRANSWSTRLVWALIGAVVGIVVQRSLQLLGVIGS